MHYTLSQKYSHDSFLKVRLELKPEKSEFELILPEWRPGRYELGNFSKYLRNFSAYNDKGEKCTTEKISKSKWIINCDSNKCIVSYEIFTQTIDGGSTYVDETHWYLNFINCLLFDPKQLSIPHQIKLEIPHDWKIACGLKSEGKTLFARNFYELVDSPALVGKSLKHLSYKVNQYNFHLWFNGEVDLKNSEKIIEDFKKFTQYQIDTMGEFENSDYHFLYQIPEFKAYHGVEHLNSTCIVLGPATEFNEEEFYDNFLGISSHELFHYWNIIRIRPQEMWPYDFEKENYFKTGYVAEGVTTYYGDLFLVRSGVKDLNWYLNELNKLLKRHFQNYGRFFSSVAESSHDLWVDGYELGTPHRKVSIYVKGAIIALMLDLKIIIKSEGKQNFDDVLRKLWNDFYKNDKGYSENDYIKTVEAILGEELSDFKASFIYGLEKVENEINQLLEPLGFELKETHDENLLARYLGIKVKEEKIVAIAPDSLGEQYFRLGDEIFSLNEKKYQDHQVENLIDLSGQNNFILNRGSSTKNVTIQLPQDKTYYDYFNVVEMLDVNEKTKLLRKAWLNV